MKKITNHFLLALPHMSDPIFKKSIIYICEHNKDGYMGLIINKPVSKNNAIDILKQIFPSETRKFPNIYFGGPIKINRGIVLHSTNYETEGTYQISKTISLTSNDNIITDLDKGCGPSKFKFIIGYAGWAPGQLEKEIENGDWLLTTLDDIIVFNTPDNEKWENAFIELGINSNSFSGGQSGIS